MCLVASDGSNSLVMAITCGNQGPSTHFNPQKAPSLSSGEIVAGGLFVLLVGWSDEKAKQKKKEAGSKKYVKIVYKNERLCEKQKREDKDNSNDKTAMTTDDSKKVIFLKHTQQKQHSPPFHAFFLSFFLLYSSTFTLHSKKESKKNTVISLKDDAFLNNRNEKTNFENILCAMNVRVFVFFKKGERRKNKKK